MGAYGSWQVQKFTRDARSLETCERVAADAQRSLLAESLLLWRGLSCLFISFCFEIRPSTDSMTPTHITEGNVSPKVC